jgi:hypothetical protein
MCPSFPFFFVLTGFKRFDFFICSYSGGRTVDALVEFVNNEAGEDHLVLKNMPAHSFVVYWIPDVQIIIG